MNRNDVLILPMETDDLENMKENLSTDFDDFWDYTTFKEDFTSTLSKYFVAKYKDTIIGWTGIKIVFEEAELMNIVVNRNYRSQMIGSYLLEHIIMFCKSSNLKIINLEVNVKNTIAIDLYKKYNFKQIGLRKKYYHGTEDAILMSLDLT